MEHSTEAIDRVYDSILSQGSAARDRYYEALRKIHLTPVPTEEKQGFLYAPNPVILSRTLVATITRDLASFCAARLEETPDGGSLAAAMPTELRSTFAGEEVAARIHEDLTRSAPFACLDCFLVSGDDGYEPAYLEWQTFPTYPATAVYCLEAMDASFEGLGATGASFSPIAGETLEQLRDRVGRTLTHGIEDDPRQGVIVDFEPSTQETAYEFDFSVELSGGPERGMGIIDPREVVIRGGRPHYRRESELIPIRSVFSRLVYRDIVDRLIPACSSEERRRLTQFFNYADLDWRVHPLHFLHGSKGDLPRFRRRKLSKFIPACETVTPDFIARQTRAGRARVDGRVQKPVEGHGGHGVIENPRISELEVGAVIQDRIVPAATHPTQYGAMTPELRVMAIPDEEGRLSCAGVFTRVKAPTEFRSNAGAIARCNIPGTGEGYALIVD